MSTPTVDDPHPTSSPLFAHTSESLYYAVNHVFLPVHLDFSDYINTPENRHSLARPVCAAAHAYSPYVCGATEQAQWHRTTKMLDNLQAYVQSEHENPDRVISQLRGIETGGMLSSYLQLRADNL